MTEDSLTRTIHALLDTATAVAESVSFTVEADEFQAWAETLGASTFYACLQSDGGVHGHVQEMHGDRWVFVHVYADMLDGIELPPLGSEIAHVAVPVADAGRLKVFEGASK